MSNFPDFGWVSMFVGRQSIFIYQNFNWYTIYVLFHGKKSADTYKNHQFFFVCSKSPREDNNFEGV